MSEIICFVPTYSPYIEADTSAMRPYERATNQEILARYESSNGHIKPSMYFDAIDSILNIRPDISLWVADGRSTESIRTELVKHNQINPQYNLFLFSEKISQWLLFNEIFERAADDTKYFIYSSSDVIWHHDWVGKAIEAFEDNSKLQILFPLVNKGDPNLPCQISPTSLDLDPFPPPFQDHARAPCLNAYAMIFRMDFLRTYGGYINVYKNCFTESFLYYQCEAMGGEMRLLPRGHVLHYGEGDKWQNPNGSPYNYTEEKLIFQEMMNNVLMHKAMDMMSVEYLKKKLYK